jgi:hypothetical protein
MTPGTILGAEDATEPADFSRSLSEWADRSRGKLADAPARFIDSHPYGIEMLRHEPDGRTW